MAWLIRRQQRGKARPVMPPLTQLVLSDIIPRPHTPHGFVFLGFSLDAQFLVSYRCVVEEEIAAGSQSYAYTLQLWSLHVSRPLSLVSSISDLVIRLIVVL